MKKETKVKKTKSIEGMTGWVKVVDGHGQVLARLDAGELPGTSSLEELVVKIGKAYECQVFAVED